MKRALPLLFLLAAAAVSARAQASGGVAYAQAGGRARAEAAERNKRALTQVELPPSATSMFVEASVLMNVRADEHVAVFGLAEECAAVEECQRKMNATAAGFLAAVKALGIADGDTHVDYVAQNKIYGFELAGNVARERLVGFELKKNVSVRYREEAMLERLVAAAARSKIFDLIKVDYVVRDTAAVQKRLTEEASRVINQKSERYAGLLGIRFQGGAQVYAERPSVYYPTEMYDSYVAFESEDVSNPYDRERHTVQRARKSRTFFFNALDADGFDTVINPVVTAPVVQFTLYLKVKYEIQQPAK
ncbi:MAG TPA: SIMPL domain-containing protein [Pyrinomonadaceae bacterium]|nr:SIMPL domain-containing protein [Pyrinomonadaceae bacterium]